MNEFWIGLIVGAGGVFLIFLLIFIFCACKLAGEYDERELEELVPHDDKKNECCRNCRYFADDVIQGEICTEHDLPVTPTSCCPYFMGK